MIKDVFWDINTQPERIYSINTKEYYKTVEVQVGERAPVHF